MKLLLSVWIRPATHLWNSLSIFLHFCDDRWLVHVSVPAKRLTDFIDLIDFRYHLC